MRKCVLTFGLIAGAILSATMLEPLPLGLLFTFVTAGVLSRKRRTEGAAVA